MAEQIVLTAGVAVPVGIGFTVIVAVKLFPVQDAVAGVIVYTTVPGVLPVELIASAIFVPQDEGHASPPVAFVFATVHVNDVPDKVLFRLIFVVPVAQNDCVEGEAEPTGLGFTVTETVRVFPAQLFAVGVTVYVAVPATTPLAVNVWLILDPHEELQLLAPVTPLCETAHV